MWRLSNERECWKEPHFPILASTLLLFMVAQRTQLASTKIKFAMTWTGWLGLQSNLAFEFFISSCNSTPSCLQRKPKPQTPVWPITNFHLWLNMFHQQANRAFWLSLTKFEYHIRRQQVQAPASSLLHMLGKSALAWQDKIIHAYI